MAPPFEFLEKFGIFRKIHSPRAMNALGEGNFEENIMVFSYLLFTM